MVDKDSVVDRNSEKLVDESSVVVQNTGLQPKGLDEKNRLCTLAGLNIKYSSEPKKIPLKES